MQIIHNIQPVYNKLSKVLILGTIPSPSSRDAGFFYMHPQNRFWSIISGIFGTNFIYPNNYAVKEEAVKERYNFILEKNIALWDVLSKCEIRGADDSSIKNPVPNDLNKIISKSNIKHIFCTGKKAFNLYKKYCSPLYSPAYSYLPSTSPANQGRWNYEKLKKEYSKIIEVLNS